MLADAWAPQVIFLIIVLVASPPQAQYPLITRTTHPRIACAPFRLLTHHPFKHAGCDMRSPAALCPAPKPQCIHHPSFSAAIAGVSPRHQAYNPFDRHPAARRTPDYLSLALLLALSLLPFPTIAPQPSYPSTATALLYLPLYCDSAFCRFLGPCNACALPPAWVHKQIVTDCCTCGRAP